jgi:hypothetical protein
MGDMKKAAENKELQKEANRIMRDNGFQTVYLAGDGQWFSKKENAEAHSDGVEVQEFKLKK